jgi:hypothetical protein
MAYQRVSHQKEVDEFRVVLCLLDMGEDVTQLAAPFLRLRWIIETTEEGSRRYAVTPEGERVRE